MIEIFLFIFSTKINQLDLLYLMHLTFIKIPIFTVYIVLLMLHWFQSWSTIVFYRCSLHWEVYEDSKGEPGVDTMWVNFRLIFGYIPIVSFIQI